jgi:hypothetical protein
MHLRIERDAADWTDMMGGQEAFWGLYLDAAGGAGLDGGLPLYVATGILSYKDADNQMADVKRRWVWGWLAESRAGAAGGGGSAVW